MLAVFAVGAQNRLIPFDAAFFGLAHNGYDLDTYRHAAMLLLDGKPLYRAPALDEAWFTYPPFAALALAPTAMAPFRAAKCGMLALSFLLLAATAWRALRLSGWRGDARLAVASLALATAAVDVEPVQSTLWWGQINILVMALSLLDLVRPSGARMRGAGVGIAAGLKLTPLVFLPYLLVTRQWRAAGWAAGVFLATVAGSWALLPEDSAAYWFHALLDTSHIAPIDHVANQSVHGFLARFWFPERQPAPLWPLLAALLLGAGLWAAKRAHDEGERLLPLVVVGLTGCAVSPFSWAAHWVWFAPAAFWLAGKAVAEHGRRRIGWTFAAAAWAAWTFMWTTRSPGDGGPRYDTGLYEHYLDWRPEWLGEVASAWYLLAFLGFLACGAVSLRRRSSSSATLVSHD